MRTKIAVLGGSFAPMTKTHLQLIRDAMSALGAERGILVPSSDDYVRRKLERKKEQDARFFASYDEFRQPVIADLIHEDVYMDKLYVSNIELIGPSMSGHTLETLGSLAASHKGSDLCFIMGAEKLKAFAKWPTARKILSKYQILAVTYRGIDTWQVNEFIKKAFPEYRHRFSVIRGTMETDDISSAWIRKLARQEDAYAEIAKLSCPKAADLIQKYRQ